MSEIKSVKHTLNGIGYIYGNTPFSPFEFNAFMTTLGMNPLLIQMSSLPPEDLIYKEEIQKYHDPYVTKSANIAPLQYVYDVLKPHLYLGHEYATRLRKKGIAIVRSDSANSMLGFEVTSYIVNELCRASKESMSYRKEVN